MTIPAILTARAYTRQRFEQFLADNTGLKRNITTEAMHARGHTNGHDIVRDFRNSALNERSETE
ncbi:hypothetical protein M3D53_09820 [Dermabacter hominis]|uniref:hypothetical protein n=1 Tax=Dermabacter hominis TaxID=36740 RepID=UPI0021A26FEE|nr:hypothetical protein [Dermabacter hominis]MCT2056932.1 hypothetical protein [Dermabacter hominis]MCT2084407.1 hypothetical protein [Dermabacter hominis]MCT2091762.1 hypothetical protein [Dermabacter hominis]MCT2190805.1 hypothetical protein [Dermabacter hominis]MCT2227958.1 hypothetical protein [Dermabacter hominis]